MLKTIFKEQAYKEHSTHNKKTDGKKMDINASEDKISHQNTRLFKPQKLSLPRDFKLPEYIVLSSTQSNCDRPLCIEIGAGKGKHALLYAKQNLNSDIIAIERTANKFSAFIRALETASLNNLLAVQADAIPYCVYALPAQSVSMIFILYPNPEPKNPNQQWLNMPFFEFLLSRLKEGGKIVLASNIETYIYNAYHKAKEIWHLPTSKSLVPNTSARTHFEIKYLQRGEVCWELEMIKPENYHTHFDDWQSPQVQNLINAV